MTFFRVRAPIACGLAILTSAVATSASATETPPVVPEMDDTGLRVHAEQGHTITGGRSSASRPVPQTAARNSPSSAPRWESQTISCSNSSADALCGAIRSTCTTTRGTTPSVTYWRQEGTSAWGAGTPSCNGSAPTAPAVVPAGAEIVQVPPTPSFAQIQQAFRELPFCKPEPAIQPVGGKTLINLPTYYRATWPEGGSCLTPGQTSEAVQLLSWSIEFRVEAQDYRYRYGDGETSGWTTSTGGTYPDGDITHTYTDTGNREVTVDARLTGSYRVNGGEWQDIDTVADLQDEPAVTYEVVATRTRLHASTD